MKASHSWELWAAYTAATGIRLMCVELIATVSCNLRFDADQNPLRRA